jgi:GH24 family phage-related lysozyme (muramidase)
MLGLMRASTQLHEYLKRREEFRAVPYRDDAGIWTIGYGHVIRPYEKKTLTRLTEPQAAELARRDLDPIELYLRAIHPRFDSPINQHQFDGWVFTTVTDGQGNRVKKRSRGLVNRRRMDRAIFERGMYAD